MQWFWNSYDRPLLGINFDQIPAFYVYSSMAVSLISLAVPDFSVTASKRHPISLPFMLLFNENKTMIRHKSYYLLDLPEK